MTSLYSVMDGSSFVVCFGAKRVMFYALSLYGYRVRFFLLYIWVLTADIRCYWECTDVMLLFVCSVCEWNSVLASSQCWYVDRYTFIHIRVYVRVSANEPPLPVSVIYCCVEIFLFLHFPVGQGLLIVENTGSHPVRHTTVGRTPLDEW
jgi:hypothetical protein